VLADFLGGFRGAEVCGCDFLYFHGFAS
jgi:hypothetical protein